MKRTEAKKLIPECQRPEYYQRLGYKAVEQPQLIEDDKARRERARALALLAVQQPRLF